MKKKSRFWAIGILAFLPIILNPNLSRAAEILYEHEWTRIVSGDRATRVTREIADAAFPTTINPKAIAAILDSIGFPGQTKTELNAWAAGLVSYGWAQFENEPEQTPYKVVQLIVVNDSGPEVIARKANLYGMVLEAKFDLKGKKLSSREIIIPVSLDRTVFHTVLSPALFILNQEHFQKHFFEGMLNLNFPGLERAKNAYEARKTLLAAHEVAEYFRRKQHPIFQAKLPQKSAESDEAAEAIMRHEFQSGDSTIKFGERIDYRNNPTENSEWIWGLNRMGHWITLLNAYMKTGNEAYAREFNLQVIDWVVRNPAPPFRLTRVPSWRNLEAGIRMSSTWPQSFFGFRAAPSLQTHAIQLMLASIWSHARHIERFPSGMRFVNNWVIIGSTGLASVGMIFPEFQEATTWAETGLNRLSEQLNKQVYPDGMQHELATGYHLACMHSFYQVYEYAQATATPVPPNFQNTLEKMFEYIMYVSTPTRQVPPTNDAHRRDIAQWLNSGAELFDRTDMQFVATYGAHGEPPAHASHPSPWGGHFVMRSDWSADAWYLFFDAGPTGVSHQHEDKLHIDVSAFGRDFLTDGGKGTYIPDKWRTYFVSTAAHNTFLIDGQGQNRIELQATHRAESELKNCWFSDDRLDFASGSYHSGYGPQRIAVNHSRTVLFKKQAYWLVLDYLTGNARHRFESLFHFTPSEVLTDDAHKTAYTAFDDSLNIQLHAAATVPVQLQIIKGQENPEQGWISTGSAHRIAAPTAIFEGEGKLPVLIATAIQPFKSQHPPEIQIEIKKSSPTQAALLIRSESGVDHWWINLENQNRIVVDGKPRTACVYFRRVKDEKIVEEFEARL
ncbi:alginate lyase family protein [candidate division KSB1 bacterium]|nr:alginate lyase family protein [candidate division KSB1 bacterium]